MGRSQQEIIADLQDKIEAMSVENNLSVICLRKYTPAQNDAYDPVQIRSLELEIGRQEAAELSDEVSVRNPFVAPQMDL